MSNTPQDPQNPGNPPANPGNNAPAGPWIYSDNTAPGYYTPPAADAPPAPQSQPSQPAPQSQPTTPPAPPPQSTAQPAPAAPAKTPVDTSLASVIDTIEAIIIALIVALTFRAFIVEAFVIPTGSMAPTLLGAHFKVVCPKCGYEFNRETPLYTQAIFDKANGCVLQQTGGDAELGNNSVVPVLELPIYCPNCRYPIAATELPQFIETRNVYPPPPNMAHPAPIPPFSKAFFPWANNGDRILVLKYLYSMKEPERWDVIVFKEPTRAGANFIKRLIGKPGETVQIVNGDIYIGGKDASERIIQRKPEELQASLWQLVYNNDYYPIDEGKRRPPEGIVDAKGDVVDYRAADPDSRQIKNSTGPWVNPWQPDTNAAQWSKGTTMAYAGNGPSALVFHPIPRAEAPRNYPPYGLNTLGYNNDLYTEDASTPRSIVGDLRLETVWTPKEGAGTPAVQLTVGRLNNCYRITWSGQGLVLERYNVEQKAFEAPTTRAADQKAQPELAMIANHLPLPEAGKAYHLAMNNIDHAVQFYIDGKEVLRFEQADWTAAKAIADAEQFPPDWSPEEADARQRINTLVRIDLSGPGTLSHLKLMRDLFYTQITPYYERTLEDWYEHPMDRLVPSGVPFEWPGHATATQGNPITLHKASDGNGVEDEYFAMGDNSRKSSDGRMWAQVYEPLGDLALRPGIVPRRFLLGKAFFVYWPAGFRPAENIPIPLVPDTGSMRMIR